MRTIPAIGAAAALMTGVSNASADDCVDGFRMIKGSIPVPCGGSYYAGPEAPVYRTDIYEGPFNSWRTYRQPYYGPGYIGSYYHPRHTGSYYAAGPLVHSGFGFGFGWSD